MIVLIDSRVSDFETLGFQEVASPENLRHDIVDANQLGFGGTFGDEALFDGSAVGCALTKTHGATCVTLHVTMNGEGGVDPPFDDHL